MSAAAHTYTLEQQTGGATKCSRSCFFHQRIKAFHSLKFKKHFYNFYKKHFLSSYFDCLNKWLDIKDYFYFFHPLINQESTNKAFFIVSVSEVFLKYIWRTNYSCSGNLPEVFLSSVQTRHDSSVQTVEATESSWLFMRCFPFLKWSNSLCVRFWKHFCDYLLFILFICSTTVFKCIHTK